jgi:hypothetical protein
MSTAVMTSPLTASEALAFLDQNLSLHNIRMKLADPEEGKGYGPEHLDLLEQEYRRFLAMHLAHPDAEIVPCKLVDEMWHQHILDTIAYRQDCDAIFGEFLDHFPYFGMRGDDDAQALADAYGDTLEIYEHDFGPPPEGTWISVDAASCKRTNCKPQKCKGKR